MDQNHSKLLQAVCDRAAASLIKVVKDGVKSVSTFDINCNELDDQYFLQDVTQQNTAVGLSTLFQASIGMTGPVLYFFEIVAGASAATLLELARAYKEEKVRAMPAIKKSAPTDTHTLYVGKVIRHFTGRLVTHFGYYRQVQTQGLQLHHWAPSHLILRLHAYEFDAEMGPLMAVLEKELAQELRPLLGLHK